MGKVKFEFIMNNNLNGKKIAVIGLGISNIAVISYLLKHDLKHLAVFDTRYNPPHVDELPSGLDLNLGPIDKDKLQDFDLVVISPGISIYHEALEAIKDKVEIIGDVELFARELKVNNSKAKIIGITGSNGKSTVTALTGHILTKCGFNTAIGANFGNAVFDILDESIDVYVLELSSFELETTKTLHLDASVILNVSEDHLDRYKGSIDLYSKAKKRIFLNSDKIIVNRDDLRTIPDDGKYYTSFGLDDKKGYGLKDVDGVTYITFDGKEILDCRALTIYGTHNELNVQASIALCNCLNVDKDTMYRAISSFVGLNHRCQLVRVLDGISFYNDSKATNVASAEAAIKGLASKHKNGIILLAGGLGKGQDFTPLKQYLGKEVSLIYCFGQDAAQILALDSTRCTLVMNMRQALNEAFLQAKDGMAVLLSPACASFDQFKGYEERGRVFANMVNHLDSK